MISKRPPSRNDTTRPFNTHPGSRNDAESHLPPLQPLPHLDHVIQMWTMHMTAQDCTTKTIRERVIVIRHLIRFLQLVDLTGVTKTDLVSFLARPGLAAGSRQSYRSTLSSFFGWAFDEDLIDHDPAARLPRVRNRAKEPDPISTEELQQLLDSGIRRDTVLKVLLYAYEGLRASEIAAIAGTDIDWGSGRLYVTAAKGRRPVWRPMHSLVLTYVLEHDYPKTSYWFPSGDSHVTGRSVSDVISKAMHRAGIAHRPHDLRKWHGTTLLALGADSLDVQHSLRHVDGQSMKAYVLPNEPRIRRAKELLPKVSTPTWLP
jgi:integrase